MKKATTLKTVELTGTVWAAPRAGHIPVADFIKAAGLPAPRHADKTPPVYEPEAWSGPQRYRANCYGYVLDAQDWLHLGDLTAPDTPMPETVCVRFNKAVADGLHPAPFESPPDIQGHYLVALVDGKGWHFYRKDADGLWSHKDGEAEASNRDGSGNLITDPKNADRGPYRNFIGYFYVPC